MTTEGTMPEQNRRLVALFRSMADLLSVQRANPYRIRAYRKAAESITTLTEDISGIAARRELEGIPGIGKDLAEKIGEFLTTGTIRSYEELRIPLPEEVTSWKTLPGLSESLVSYLYFRLGIRTLPDLETLIRSHLLRTLPGFTGSEDYLLQAVQTLRRAKTD